MDWQDVDGIRVRTGSQAGTPPPPQPPAPAGGPPPPGRSATVSPDELDPIRTLGMVRPPPMPPGPKQPLPTGEHDWLWNLPIEGLKIGGMVLGSRVMPGLLAARAAGPLTALETGTAAAAGAGVAGAGMEAAHLAGKSLAGSPPPSVHQAATDIAAAGSQGVTGELMAPPIAAGLRVLAKPFQAAARGITNTFFGPMSKEGTEAYEYLSGNLTAGQARNSPFLTQVEGWLASNIGSGGPLRKQAASAAGRLRSRADDLLREIGAEGGTPQEAGHLIRDAAVVSSGIPRVERELQHATRMGRGFETAAGQARGDLQRGASSIPSAERRGKFIQDLTEAAHTEARDAASKLYDEVDAMVGRTGNAGQVVDLADLAQFVEAEGKRRGALGKALAPGQVRGVMGAVKSAAQPEEDAMFAAAAEHLQIPPEVLKTEPAFGALVRALGDAGIEPAAMDAGTLTFRQAHSVRSALGRILRDAQRTGNSDMVGVASQLRERMDQAMTKAAGGADSPLRIAYDQATSAWKGMAQTFEEGILADVAEKDARLVTDHLLQPGRVQDLRKVFGALGPTSQRTMRAAALEKLLKDDAGDWVQGGELKKRLLAMNRGEGGETISTLFGKGGAARLEDLQRSMRGAEAYTATATAKGKELATLRRGVPEAQEAFQSLLKKGNGEAIQVARQVLGEDWRQIQARHLGDLVEAKASGKMLDTLQSLGPETVEAIYPDRRLREGIYQFARVAEQLAKTEVRTSSWPLRLQVGTAAATAAGALTGTLGVGTAIKAGMGILLTPTMLQRVLANPQARSALIGAMKQPETKLGHELAGQLGAFLLREGLIPRGEAGLAGPPPRVEGPGTTGAPPSVGGRSGGPGPVGAGGGPLAPPPAVPRSGR